MKTTKAIPKHTFYEKLAVRTKKENYRFKLGHFFEIFISQSF